MKVTSVTCHLLQSKVDKPFVSARGWVYSTRSSCIVEIATDAGITGRIPAGQTPTRDGRAVAAPVQVFCTQPTLVVTDDQITPLNALVPPAGSTPR